MARGRVVLGTCALALTLGVGVGSAIPASADSTADAPQGQQLATPDREISGYQIVKLDNANVANFERRYVYCPAGKRVLGGGAEARGVDSVLNGSFPTEDGRGWIGIGHQPGYTTVGISVFAVCADV